MEEPMMEESMEEPMMEESMEEPMMEESMEGSVPNEEPITAEPVNQQRGANDETVVSEEASVKNFNITGYSGEDSISADFVVEKMTNTSRICRYDTTGEHPFGQNCGNNFNSEVRGRTRGASSMKLENQNIRRKR